MLAGPSLSTSHPTADWLHAGGSYFTTEYASFDIAGGRWRVPFWRMPMGALVDELVASGLCLDRLVEPVPPPDARGIDARLYDRLTTEPAFLVTRARRI